jgi:hypothetical protein
MDLANFDEFKQAFERLRQQTRDLSRARRKSERSRKLAASISPEELARLAAQLAKDAGDLAKLSRAKSALLLRRDRALNRARRLSS